MQGMAGVRLLLRMGFVRVRRSNHIGRNRVTQRNCIHLASTYEFSLVDNSIRQELKLVTTCGTKQLFPHTKHVIILYR